MPRNKLKLLDQIEKAYREIGHAPDMSIEEKMKKLRRAYRQAWFDSCVEAESKWLDRRDARLITVTSQAGLVSRRVD